MKTNNRLFTYIFSMATIMAALCFAACAPDNMVASAETAEPTPTTTMTPKPTEEPTPTPTPSPTPTPTVEPTPSPTPMPIEEKVDRMGLLDSRISIHKYKVTEFFVLDIELFHHDYYVLTYYQSYGYASDGILRTFFFNFADGERIVAIPTEFLFTKDQKFDEFNTVIGYYITFNIKVNDAVHLIYFEDYLKEKGIEVPYSEFSEQVKEGYIKAQDLMTYWATIVPDDKCLYHDQIIEYGETYGSRDMLFGPGAKHRPAYFAEHDANICVE